ncbi:hypothetical protein [Amycolatopsis kentuckyensis]|uniref:hypothetical protein n=1 Tax=Amycolatopsis kentuckyensis TaxID=218823 RepID=UPI00356236AE
MPRRKPSIGKRDGQWTVTIPGYGFAADETHRVDSQPAGVALLRDRSYPRSILGGSSPRDMYGPNWMDGIAPIPRWDPCFNRPARRR